MRSRSIYFLTLLSAILATAAMAAEEIAPAPAPAPPPAPPALYSNLGHLRHPITTKSFKVQRYFDQGLRLTFAFQLGEAIADYKEAARIDPDCAICYWGIALAMGPNINLPMDPKSEPAAYEAAQKAKALASKGSEVEREYIEALTKRYAADPGNDRTARDQDYADAMREVAHRHPNDPDAAVLFAEALMVLHPWDYWNPDGKAKPGTEEIVKTLEAVIKKKPSHAGACHDYIIVMASSGDPGRGLRCAKRLPKLMPGAGHLAHVPAHIYMRVGMYREAVEANRLALHVDEQYFEGRNGAGFYRRFLYPHHLHSLFAAESMEGRSAEAIKTARDLGAKASNDRVQAFPSLEIYTPMPLFALARFGKWEEILKKPPPPDALRYASGAWRYVRGLAFLSAGKVVEARAELDALNQVASTIPPEMTVGVATPVQGLLKIASNVLAGELALKKGGTDEAVSLLEDAVRTEDGIPYDEPSPWYEPVRQRLGAALLAAGRAAEAEKVYREDLKRNPNNGWSLFGLKESLKAEGNEKEAAAVEARFLNAWKRADVVLK